MAGLTPTDNSYGDSVDFQVKRLCMNCKKRYTGGINYYCLTHSVWKKKSSTQFIAQVAQESDDEGIQEVDPYDADTTYSSENVVFLTMHSQVKGLHTANNNNTTVTDVIALSDPLQTVQEAETINNNNSDPLQTVQEAETNNNTTTQPVQHPDSGVLTTYTTTQPVQYSDSDVLTNHINNNYNNNNGPLQTVQEPYHNNNNTITRVITHNTTLQKMQHPDYDKNNNNSMPVVDTPG